MSREDQDRMGTADLVAGAEHRDEPVRQQQLQQPQREGLRGEMDPRQHERMQREGMPRDPAAREAMPREAMQRDAMQRPAMQQQGAEQLVALFPPEMAAQFRSQWDQVQIGFVDDPREAVRHADELVAQVMKSLASSFADQRARLEAGLGQGDQANTENLRMALRGYRSFFQRLLSL